MKNKHLRNLNKLFKQIIIHFDVTVTDLSRVLDVNQMSIRNWMDGDNLPNLDSLTVLTLRIPIRFEIVGGRFIAIDTRTGKEIKC